MSDGKYAPRELVRRAAGLKLETIAITDHDTVSGVAEALSAGKEYGVEIISGIELSVNDGKASFHLLGFGIDDKNAELASTLVAIREERVTRAQEIVRRLQAAGFRITYEDVLRQATGSSVGRPHIAQALLANPENKKILGEEASVKSVIEGYLVLGKPTYVERESISMESGIGLLHRAGGVAVWSHPAIHKLDFVQLEERLKKFIGWGLDGLEAFNPAQTEEQVKFLYRLADKYGILRTAGSDFHTDEGGGGRIEGGSELASFPAYGFDVSDVVSKLKEFVAGIRKEI
ncbi:MAG: PHP domain-containing protein [Candidatus Sungbacteria bacterium]|nr:PHP domain-containing protein [Candidatus Sungbacteria bacterium]